MRDTLRSMDSQLRICFVLLILWGLAMAGMANALGITIFSGGEVVDEPGRFSSIELAEIVKQAQRADPFYYQVGGIVTQYKGDVGLMGLVKERSNIRLILSPLSPLLFTPAGACSSNEECHSATDEMCEEAGHEGADSESTEIQDAPNGSQVCSSDCSDGSGAVAIIICSAHTVIDEPDPTGWSGGYSEPDSN